MTSGQKAKVAALAFMVACGITASLCAWIAFGQTVGLTVAAFHVVYISITS